MEQVRQQENGGADDLLSANIFNTAKIAGIAAIISLAGALAGAASSFLNPVSMPTGTGKEGFDDKTVQQIAQGGAYLSTFFSLLVSGMAFWFLLRFSTLAKTAITNGNATQLGGALKNLASYFKIWGIIMLLIVSLFVFSLLGGILGGAVGG